MVATVLAAYRYDAFGNKLAMMGAFADAVGYRGERFDPVLAQYYLRARFYDPRTGRFTARDMFAGNQLIPLSLHRYLYANDDPINFSDPSGNFAAATLAGSSGFRAFLRTAWSYRIVRIGVLLVGAYGLGWLQYFHSAHPDDKTTAEYQARLDKITNLIRVMKRVGDAYSQGGFPAVSQSFPHWNPPGGFTPLPGVHMPPFPPNWNDLSEHMQYTVDNYNRISRMQVTVGTYFGGAGHNISWYPGLHISHDEFWNEDATSTVDTLIHEAYHSRQFWPGHGSDIAALVAIPPSENEAALTRFIDRAKRHRDNNQKTLWKYMLQEAGW